MQTYIQEFGQVLVDMEWEGMFVDTAHLASMEILAEHQQRQAVQRFRDWAASYVPEAKDMNVGSDEQIRTLLFGGIPNRREPRLC